MENFQGWLSAHHPSVGVLRVGHDVFELRMHGKNGLWMDCEVSGRTMRNNPDTLDSYFHHIGQELAFWERLQEGFVVDKRVWTIAFQDETENSVKIVFKLKEEAHAASQ